jgi:hypothetical protein
VSDAHKRRRQPHMLRVFGVVFHCSNLASIKVKALMG